MSEVYAGYSIKVKNANGDADNEIAQKIYDYCKEHFDWFAEWGDGPFYIKKNTIYSDAEFGIKSAGNLLDDPMGWLRTVCEKVKPEQMDVSISTDASECGGWYVQREITASVKDGVLRVDNDLEYDRIEENEPLLFADCDELEGFSPCRSPDSLCDNLLAKNYNTFKIDVLWFVFKDGEGEEIKEPIRINPGDCDDVQEALQCGTYYLEQGCDVALRDSKGNAVTRLADIDVKSVIQVERKMQGDESIEFLGIQLPGVEKPIMLEAWKTKVKKEKLSDPVFGTFTDPRDGHVYKTVKFGGQEWLAENFAYKCDDSYAPKGEETLVEEYGLMYTAYAAMECAPEGWHLPKSSEFKTFVNNVSKFTGIDAGTALKSATDDWIVVEGVPKGTDCIGFGILPVGHFDSMLKKYNAFGACSYFWTSDSIDQNLNAFAYAVMKEYSEVKNGRVPSHIAVCVRLIKDDGEYLKKLAEKEAARKAKEAEEKRKREEAAAKRDAAEKTKKTFTDPRDGQVYKTIKIGDQEWLAENFAYECEGSCAYDNDENNVKKYGRLYTWEAAMKCAPEGWHLPTKQEFKLLESYVKEHTDTAVGLALKSMTNDWEEDEGSPKVTDEFGFCALPAGYRSYYDGFVKLGENAYFWSASEYGCVSSFRRGLSCRRYDCSGEDFNEDCANKKNSFSVRLVRD